MLEILKAYIRHYKTFVRETVRQVKHLSPANLLYNGARIIEDIQGISGKMHRKKLFVIDNPHKVEGTYL